MAEKRNNNFKKSTRHLYDMESGFPLMINLFMIKYIYYHIDKHEKFIEKKEIGKKPKSVEIYQNELPMSRPRFDRINKGYRFELSIEESIFITDRYGIDMKYFRKDNPAAFALEGITQTEWKCFYNAEHKVGYELPRGYSEEAMGAKAEKVKAALRRLTERDWEKRIAKDDPLFAVCYYFHYGKRYDAPSNLDLFRERIKNIEFGDWDNADIGQLRDDLQILEKHCKYINSLITIRELKKN